MRGRGRGVRWGSCWWGGGGQGGCERRIKFFGKIKKNGRGGGVGEGSGRVCCFFLGGEGGAGVRGGGRQGGCERRIKVFVKIQRKKWGESGGVGGRSGRVWGGGRGSG